MRITGGPREAERVLEGAISKRTCVHFAKYTYIHAWSHDTYAYIGDMPDPFGMNMSLSRRRWTGILRSRHTHVCWSNNPFHLAVQRSSSSSSFYDKPGRSFFLLDFSSRCLYMYIHVAAMDLLPGKSGDRNSMECTNSSNGFACFRSIFPETRQFREIGVYRSKGRSGLVLTFEWRIRPLYIENDHAIAKIPVITSIHLRVCPRTIAAHE